MSKYIIVIHGGDSFNSYDQYIQNLRDSLPRYRNNYVDWKGSLIDTVSPEFTLLQPQMPNGSNAKYSEWEITIDKIMNILPTGTELILIGHSLGANFWRIYLENKELKHKILQLHLVAGCLSEGDFKASNNWSLINTQSPNKEIYIWHSTDDSVVNYSEAIIYNNKLINSKLHTFSDRGHFNQPHFEEIVAVINKLAY